MVKHLQTVAAMACMKTLLMVFNIIFWLSGVGILAIGIWMEIELYKYMAMSTEFSSTVSYSFIATGIFTILVASFACCCTVKGQPGLLYIYGAFLALVMLMEIGVGISMFTYRTKLEEGFDQGLTKAMMKYRTDTQQMALNFDTMQETLKCCGKDQYTDWLNLSPAQPVPSSCCIKENCDTDDENAIYKQGCAAKIKSLLNDNVGIVAGSAVAVAFFPLIGVILSCCLASIINKAKYEQMA